MLDICEYISKLNLFKNNENLVKRLMDKKIIP